MSTIRFRFAPAKARSAVQWMLGEARPEPLDLHTILKTCYFADKAHLNRWGRPVFGARCRAMRDFRVDGENEPPGSAPAGSRVRHGAPTACSTRATRRPSRSPRIARPAALALDRGGDGQRGPVGRGDLRAAAHAAPGQNSSSRACSSVNGGSAGKRLGSSPVSAAASFRASR